MKPASAKSLQGALNAIYNAQMQSLTAYYKIIPISGDALDSPELWMRENLPSVFAEWDKEYWTDLENEFDAWEGSLE